ncbi:MAG: glutamyl-tRNA reductase [Ginsengibacter sp.]
MIVLDTEHYFLDNFCVAGINYRKSDISVRGRFSLLPEQSTLLLQQDIAKRFPSCMVLSTCNRTEIYGICDHPNELIELLCIYTHGNMSEFIKHGYNFQGESAIEHLFEVAAGLDSQIVGDYEILAQIKQAAKVSKLNGCMNTFMEKVINYALQSSKKIKTNTRLSSGTVSVSYAAIEIIREKIAEIKGKKILLIGTGKFGQHVGKNLQNYFPEANLFFTNRTDQKAKDLAESCDATFVPYDDLSKQINEADIIIVSSTADSYTVLPSFFIEQKHRLLLDLSVPQNVDPSVKMLPGVELLNVDEISLILDKTIALRQAEIPKAMEIIAETLHEMMDWYRRRSNSPLLRKIKVQLRELSQQDPLDKYADEKIHKAVSSLAVQLHNEKNKGCQYISALSSYLQKIETSN